MKRILYILIVTFIFIFSGCNDCGDVLNEERSFLKESYLSLGNDSDKWSNFAKENKGKFVKWKIEIEKIESKNKITAGGIENYTQVQCKFNYDFNKEGKYAPGDIITISGAIDSYEDNFLDRDICRLYDCRIENMDEDEKRVKEEKRNFLELSYFLVKLGQDSDYTKYSYIEGAKGQYIKWTAHVKEVEDNNDLLLQEEGYLPIRAKFSYPATKGIKEGQIITFSGTLKDRYFYDKDNQSYLIENCRIENTTDKDMYILNNKITGERVDKKEKLNQVGNSNGNIVNGGYILCDENVKLIEGENNLIKNDIDEVFPKEIRKSEFVNKVGDSYYYRSEGAFVLCKMDVFTGKSKIICYDKPFNIIAEDDNIYFINETDGDKIYKIDKDGQNKTKLTNCAVWRINVFNGKIYYSNSDGIFRMNDDGKGVKKLSSHKGRYLNYYNGYLYYCNQSDNDNIYRVKEDGSSNEKVCSDKAYTINVYKDYIYYTNEDDGYKIYSIKIDGSGKRKLNNHYSKNINIAGDWIFYANHDDWDYIYMLNRNGNKELRTEWMKVFLYY